MPHSMRIFPLRRGILLVLAGLTLGSVPGARAQIHPPKPGVPMPRAYYDRVAEDRTAFQFRRAWHAEARRIRENIRRRELADLGFLGASSVGDTLVVSGIKNVPVIAGKFANSAGDPYTVAELQDQLFDGPNPTGTVTQYYDEISYGNIDLTGSVIGNGDSLWVVAQDDTYYEGADAGPGDPCNGLCGNSKVGEFLQELLDFSDPGTDFGIYDNDGPDGLPNSGDDDGYVDFVAFVHPEWGGECGSTNIWSHRWVYEGWWGSSYVTDDPAAGGGFIRVSDYTIQPLVSCNQNDIIEIGVYAHEFGHAFGLPDLYDTNGGSQGIGNWGLMASGSYGGDGNHPETPSHMCAWSKSQLGWVQPELLCGDATGLSLPDAANNPDVYKIYPRGVPDSEYFLVENRVKTGFDLWLSNSGLTIWHIDDDQPGNQDENHKLVDLEEADGNDDLDNAVNRSDPGDVYPGSSNNTTFDDASYPNSRNYAGDSTGVGIVNIDATVNPRGFDVQVPDCRPFVAEVILDDSPCGNNTGAIDAGETADLLVCLGSGSPDDFLSLSGVLVSLTPGVAVTQDTTGFAPLSCGDQVCGTVPFRIEADSTIVPATVILLRFDGVADGLPFSEDIELRAGGYVLLVEDDGAASEQALFTGPIAAAGYTVVVHETSVSGTPSLALLQGAFATVWYTGESFDATFTASEQAVVEAYLAGGGSLFVTGQDIGYDLVSQGSSVDQAFYQDWLHADFVSDTSSDNTLTGLGGDPIGGGLSLNLSAGDGADNSTWPSVINPRAGASGVFVYSGANEGAVRYETGHRLVYFAFNFESINASGTRNTVMDRVLDYLVPGDVTSPLLAVSAPVGGAAADVGDTVTVSWSASDDVGVDEVEVFVSRDGGGSYASLALLAGSATQFDWETCGEDTGSVRFKVIARDATGLQGVDFADDFDLVDLDGPAAAVVYPDGGEALDGGTSEDIAWSMADCSGVDSTEVRVSYDNGDTWSLLAVVAAPDTSWSWAVPDTSADSCLVEIRVHDAHGNVTPDVSNGVFSIAGSALAAGDDAPGVTVPVLARVYPNPTRGAARIAFSLPADTRVSLRVYDLQGRVIRTLVEGTSPAGFHEHTWDGTGDDGRRAAAGIYFTVLDTPDQRQTRKLVLAR